MNQALGSPAFLRHLTGTVMMALLLSACTGQPMSTTGPTSIGQRGTLTALSDAKINVKYFQAVADMSVKNVTMDFFPAGGKVLGDPKEDGNQFVRVEMMFENPNTEVFKMNYTNIQLDTPTEKGIDITFYINDSNVSDLLKSKDLAQGESLSGALYYEVPANLKAEDLTVSYTGYEGMESKDYKIPLK